MFTIADLFKMQETFNERIGFDAARFAKTFSVAGQQTDFRDYQGAKLDAGVWIDNFIKAMSSEMEELRNCTYWKHWCQEAQEGRRYEIKDIESCRKEIIDMLHFWISFAQALGMTPEMVCGMYSSKLTKNIKRQDDGYCIEIKDKAWKLFLEHPDMNPELGSLTGESLEDLSPEAQEYYIEWAKGVLALDDPPYCDCLDTKFNTGPKEDVASILPEPDPNCTRCGGEGYVLQAPGQMKNCVGAGDGCKYCGQPDCTVRRYQSTIPGGQNES